jgi:plasmid stability protein
MAQMEQVKFVLRLPPALHKKIKRRAKANNTSMNKEITNILNDAVSGSSVEVTLNNLVARLEKKRVI